MPSPEKSREIVEKILAFIGPLFGVIGASFVTITFYGIFSLIPAWYRGEMADWSWQSYWLALFPFPGSILCFAVMYGVSHRKRWTVYPLLLFALLFPRLYATPLFWISLLAVIIGFFRLAVVRTIFTD